MPTDNPFIEAFNGRLWQACLGQNWFTSLEDARTISEETPPSVLGSIVGIGALLALGAVDMARQDARDVEIVRKGISAASR